MAGSDIWQGLFVKIIIYFCKKSSIKMFHSVLDTPQMFLLLKIELLVECNMNIKLETAKLGVGHRIPKVK